MDTVVEGRANSKKNKKKKRKKGKKGKAVLTLTERKTNKNIVRKINSKSALEVVRVLDQLEREMGSKAFRETFKSITVDNGAEFSDAEGIERSKRNKTKRTTVYFCHPYRATERARNENNNKLIRRHLKKGSTFNDLTNAKCKKIEEWMNNYPRKIYGGKSSDEMYEYYIHQEQELKASG